MEIQYKFERISDNIYAFIQGNGDWFLSNSGLILGKEYAIVVDSLTNEKVAKQFISEIKRVTNKPIKYLINTHEHGDHLWTNHLFQNATTICHKNCRERVLEEMKSRTNPYEELFKEIDFTGFKYTPQEVTIDSEMRIFVNDEMEIRLVYVGYAHTVSDIYVYVPNEKVAFTGDLLFSPPCTPFALMGYIHGYINALEELANLDAEIYVPGHGEVSHGRKNLYEARDYLIFVRDEARKLIKTIDDPIKASHEINLGKYEEWLSKERIVGNIARAYSELRGDPPASKLQNMDKIILEMMKYRKYGR